ncbi:hypothetical protein Tco_1135681 [Tanacetum coccineum]
MIRKLLNPYDRASQSLFAINGPFIAATPYIKRISLSMSVDSIVRDIPQMSKRIFWAYNELLEAEAKILLALYRKLDLNPYPNFDRLCKKPTTIKLNLDFRAMRQKRLRHMSVPKKSNFRTSTEVKVQIFEAWSVAMKHNWICILRWSWKSDVSFIVNIFPDGYTIDKSLKVCDRPKDSFEPAGVSINGPFIAVTPSIRRISLGIGWEGVGVVLDSIVRDIPQMSKRNFCAYSELLEAEAKILLALYRKLDLNPYPNFDRLCKKPTTIKLNLDLRCLRREAVRHISVPEKLNFRTSTEVK